MFNLKEKFFAAASSLILAVFTILPASAKLPEKWKAMEEAVKNENKTLISQRFAEFSSDCSFIVVEAQRKKDHKSYVDATKASRIMELMAKVLSNKVQEKKYAYDCLYYNSVAAELKAEKSGKKEDRKKAVEAILKFWDVIDVSLPKNSSKSQRVKAETKKRLDKWLDFEKKTDEDLFGDLGVSDESSSSESDNPGCFGPDW